VRASDNRVCIMEAHKVLVAEIKSLHHTKGNIAAQVLLTCQYTVCKTGTKLTEKTVRFAANIK